MAFGSLIYIRMYMYITHMATVELLVNYMYICIYNAHMHIHTFICYIHVQFLVILHKDFTPYSTHLQVSKGHQEHSFYSLPEFDQWRATTEGAHTWKTKYYKGLGTSTAKEAKEYFSDMERHRIPFKYSGPEDDDAILLVSNKFMYMYMYM